MVKITGDIVKSVREEAKEAMKEIGVSDSVEKSKSEFIKLCALYGLKPQHYGINFFDKAGNRCTITSINKRAKKFPIVYTCNGKPMKASEHYIIQCLKDSEKF